MVSHLQVSGDFVCILLVIYVISAAEIVPAKLKRGVNSLPQFKRQNVDVEVIVFILLYENVFTFILFIFDFQNLCSHYGCSVIEMYKACVLWMGDLRSIGLSKPVFLIFYYLVFLIYPTPI